MLCLFCSFVSLTWKFAILLNHDATTSEGVIFNFIDRMQWFIELDKFSSLTVGFDGIIIKLLWSFNG